MQAERKLKSFDPLPDLDNANVGNSAFVNKGMSTGISYFNIKETNMYSKILKNIKENKPLVHCITNFVTVNDCANIILASGGSPIMADDIDEVEDITTICNSLVINIGTLNKRTIKSMITAGKKANELSHPVILDPVGVGASALRNEAAFKLLKEVKFSVIRGNISEIKFLASGAGETKGVDASPTDVITAENIIGVVDFAKKFSERTGAVIVITGATDIVADKQKAFVIKNGHPMMSRVTGTGCMLTSVIGTFIGANTDNILEAAVCGVCAMGLCGELAFKKLTEIEGGTNTYRMFLIDYMSVLTKDMLEEGAKYEIK